MKETIGDAINVRTRKDYEPPRETPISLILIVIGIAAAGIIAGVIYMVR